MPTIDRPDYGSPAAWLRYAVSDLRVAEAEPPSGVLLETLTYHAQQAAEKALNGVLLHLTGTPTPRTHDIVLLLTMVGEAGASGPLPIDAMAAQVLTEHAILTRYPSDLGEIDVTEWQEAVAHARGTLAWAEGVIAGQQHPDYAASRLRGLRIRRAR